jgi:hypothetical protein
MTISTCPDDVNAVGDPLVDNRIYYDAYAVARHSICGITTQSEELINGLPPSTKYDYTMYAILHPDAVVCTSSNGDQIDMVAVLKDLGYHVKIYDEAVKEVEMTADPYVRDNIAADVGLQDLVRLHAYRLTKHPAVILVEPDTLFLEPIDEAFDALLADDSIEASYVKSADGLVDTGSMIIKPSETTFTDIKDTFINTPYTAANGWGGSGIGAGGPGSGGMGSKGFLTYYYEGAPTPTPSTELDKCTYGNDMSAACRTKNIGEVKVAKIGEANCPPSWKCDNTGEEFQLCKDFHSKWSEKRKDFENMHWKLTPFASRKGTVDTDSFKGYCSANDKSGYHNMLEWTGQPATNSDGVPYIPQEIYQDEALIGCGTMNCGTDFVSADCTCVTDPCDACPEGTRCQNDGINPPMCIDCTCGFCDYDDRPCCDFNGVNNCKAASSRKECKMQNGKGPIVYHILFALSLQLYFCMFTHIVPPLFLVQTSLRPILVQATSAPALKSATPQFQMDAAVSPMPSLPVPMIPTIDQRPIIATSVRPKTSRLPTRELRPLRPSRRLLVPHARLASQPATSRPVRKTLLIAASK